MAAAPRVALPLLLLAAAFALAAVATSPSALLLEEAEQLAAQGEVGGCGRASLGDDAATHTHSLAAVLTLAARCVAASSHTLPAQRRLPLSAALTSKHKRWQNLLLAWPQTRTASCRCGRATPTPAATPQTTSGPGPASPAMPLVALSRPSSCAIRALLAACQTACRFSSPFASWI